MLLWGVFLEVDDGFWEGELDGRTGVFPSMFVEIIHLEGEEQDEEVRPQPLVRASRRPTLVACCPLLLLLLLLLCMVIVAALPL